MISWNDVKYFNINNPPLNNFKRKCHDEKKYTEYLDFLKKKSITPHDNIIKNIIGDNKYVVVKNTFPYDLNKGIEHWLLWVNPKDKLNISEIDTIIKNKFKTCVYFSNIEKNKSVKTIEHYQILVYKG